MSRAEQFYDAVARERARLLAAQRIASDSEARARVEAVYGVDYCRRNYPEAYGSGWAKVLDRVRGRIPFPFEA